MAQIFFGITVLWLYLGTGQPVFPAKHKVKFPACPNCNHQFETVDNFCPNCGQENHDLNMPFGHVVLEILEGFFHFDTKVFRTLKLLLFKPGQLTEQFIQNRRAGYVPPIRLYIFISFIFFLVLNAGFFGRQESEAQPEVFITQDRPKTKIRVNAAAAQDLDGVGFSGISSTNLKQIAEMNDQGLDSVLKSNNWEHTNLNRAGLRKMSRFMASGEEAQNHKIFKMFSLLMFLLMPLFALIVKGSYFQRKQPYVQFLVLSLHYHCFMFLVLTAAFLLEAFTHWEWVVKCALLLCGVYLFVALWHLFRQNPVRTFFKTIFIETAYFFCLACSLGLAFALSVALS
jgi:predicted RNA-binding Zn-ribbon protein involved in translation (DUF1610 family)